MTPESELRQSIIDEEHLRLLGLGYLVSAILSACFSLMGLVYASMGMVFIRAMPAMPADAGPSPPPEFIGWFFGLFGVGIFVVMITMAFVKFLTYRFMSQRRHRTFCMIVAGVCCAGLPYGTALGVCTLLVMNRRSVERLFGVPAASPRFVSGN